MSLPQGLVDLIDERINERLAEVRPGPNVTGTAAGTVASRTGATTALVVFDGSAQVSPVKVFGDITIDEGDRVGLVRVGVDWTIVGTFTRRNLVWPIEAHVGDHRIEAGADTPPELQAYNILEALLFYVTDRNAPYDELGYFFIGTSNNLDGLAQAKTLLFGSVKYPVPNNPASAGVADVKANFQTNLFGTDTPGVGWTIFKDSHIHVYSTVPQIILDNADTFFRGTWVAHTDGVVSYFSSGTTERIDSGATFRALNGATFERLNGGNVSVGGDPGKGIVHWTYSNSASANTVAGAPFSAKIITLTINSLVFESGRAYSLELFGGFQSATAACSGNFFVHKGNVAGTGTVWWDYWWGPQAQGEVRGITPGPAYLRRTAAGNLTTDISIQLLTNASGSGNHYADASHVRGLVVRDVGTAGDFAFATAVT
jgi:hypothetical protein